MNIKPNKHLLNNMISNIDYALKYLHDIKKEQK